MNKLQTIGSSAAVVLVAVAGLATPALALSGPASIDKCSIVVQNLSTALNNMHDISNRRETAYNDAVTRVTKELKDAQNAGYDITQLQADYKALNADLLQFHTDRQTLEVDLTNVLSVSQTDCGSGTGQFVDALKIARAQLTVLRADDVKIRVDIRQKLITDIRAYITWLKGKTTTGATAD